MYIYNTSLKAFNAEVLWITGFFFFYFLSYESPGEVQGVIHWDRK